MLSHKLRFQLLFAAWCVIAVGIIVLVALGRSTEEIAAVSGIEAALTPALVDAALVERRRRTPGRAAVADDVDPPKSGS